MYRHNSQVNSLLSPLALPLSLLDAREAVVEGGDGVTDKGAGVTGDLGDIEE